MLIKSWCVDRKAFSWGRPTAEQQVAIARGMVDYWHYCRRFVASPSRPAGRRLLLGAARRPRGRSRSGQRHGDQLPRGRVGRLRHQLRRPRSGHRPARQHVALPVAAPRAVGSARRRPVAGGQRRRGNVAIRVESGGLAPSGHGRHVDRRRRRSGRNSDLPQLRRRQPPAGRVRRSGRLRHPSRSGQPTTSASARASTSASAPDWPASRPASSSRRSLDSYRRYASSTASRSRSSPTSRSAAPRSCTWSGTTDRQTHPARVGGTPLSPRRRRHDTEDLVDVDAAVGEPDR